MRHPLFLSWSYIHLAWWSSFSTAARAVVPEFGKAGHWLLRHHEDGRAHLPNDTGLPEGDRSDHSECERLLENPCADDHDPLLHVLTGSAAHVGIVRFYSRDCGPLQEVWWGDANIEQEESGGTGRCKCSGGGGPLFDGNSADVCSRVLGRVAFHKEAAGVPAPTVQKGGLLRRLPCAGGRLAIHGDISGDLLWRQAGVGRRDPLQRPAVLRLLPPDIEQQLLFTGRLLHQHHGRTGIRLSRLQPLGQGAGAPPRPSAGRRPQFASSPRQHAPA
mmetsp:Transcript_27237/g.63477  ORF Transcript_27237/g.63477 Transcript_27237/m.63477 type:complete len:274 (+) Transcript_27237:929-1750(+)